MGILSISVKICLCCIFFCSGVSKLTPKWGEDVYTAMDLAFRERYTPFWQEMLLLPSVGIELDAGLLKALFGSIEVLCAFLLFTPFKAFASIVLFGLMSSIMLTHLFLGEFSELPMPVVLCCTSIGVCFLGGPPALAGGGMGPRIPNLKVN